MKIDTLIEEQEVTRAPERLASNVMNHILIHEVLTTESTLKAPSDLKNSIMKEVKKEYKAQNAISKKAKITSSLLTLSAVLWILLSPEDFESQKNYLSYFNQMDFGILNSLHSIEYNWGALFSMICIALSILLILDQKLRRKA